MKNVNALKKVQKLKQDLREWKEAQDTTRLLCTIASAVVSAASVAVIADYSMKKKKDQDGNATPLVLGVVGLVASAVVAGLPDYLAAKKLTVEDMLNDHEAGLMDENISEVLNHSADHGVKSNHPQQIELDEDTTIEDFIFD